MSEPFDRDTNLRREELKKVIESASGAPTLRYQLTVAVSVITVVFAIGFISLFITAKAAKDAAIAASKAEAAVETQELSQEILRELVNCTSPGPNPLPDTGHICFDRAYARTATSVQGLLHCVYRKIDGLELPPECVTE